MSMRMKTILVVDDEEMNLKMVEYILQQEGYDVVRSNEKVNSSSD